MNSSQVEVNNADAHFVSTWPFICCYCTFYYTYLHKCDIPNKSIHERCAFAIQQFLEQFMLPKSTMNKLSS